MGVLVLIYIFANQYVKLTGMLSHFDTIPFARWPANIRMKWHLIYRSERMSN